MQKKSIFFIFLILLISGIFYILNSPYRLHRVQNWLAYENEKTLPHKPLRAKIITDDNVTLAYSEYVYHLSFLSNQYTQEEFQNLLEMIDKDVKINEKSALKRYFRNKKDEYKIVLYAINEKNKTTIEKILDTQEKKKNYAFTLSGERRVYPYKETLTPVIGYTKKLIDKDDFTYLKGKDGLEAYYDDTLKKEDIHLAINFKLQKNLEKEVDELKTLYNAREVISIILDPETFYIKAFASTSRYNPKSIRQSDYINLRSHALNMFFYLEDVAKPFLDAIVGDFGKNIKLSINETSGIDLPFEKIVNNSNKPQVNFLQFVKVYSIFYTGGKAANLKIVPSPYPQEKMLMTSSNLDEIDINTKDTLIKFNDGNSTGFVYSKKNLFNGKKMMQSYMVIN